MDTIVNAEEITKSFGKQIAVRNVSMEVKREIFTDLSERTVQEDHHDPDDGRIGQTLFRQAFPVRFL